MRLRLDEWGAHYQANHKATEKGLLFVETKPSGARVRILNIKPKFHQGIKLKAGPYHLEVSAKGYNTKKVWVKLNAGEDKKLVVRLLPVKNSLNADDFFQSGKVLEETSDYRAAIESYTKAIELKPKEVKFYVKRSEAYVGLAEQYSKDKNNRKSIENYRYAINDTNRIIELLKNDQSKTLVLEIIFMTRSKYYNLLAETYNKNGKHEQAIESYLQAFEDSEVSIRLSSLIGIRPSWNAYLNKGMACLGLKKFKQGIKIFNKALRENLENEVAVKVINWKLDEAYNEYKSEEDLDAAWEMFPSRAAEIHYSNHNYHWAINAATEAIELDSEDALAYLTRGVSHLKLKNNQQALKDFSKAIKINPRDKNGFYYLCNTYYLIHNYQQAIKDCSKCIQQNPSDLLKAEVQSILGGSHYMLGNYQQSIINFNMAIELNPAIPEYYRRRGFAYKRLDNLQQYIMNLKTAAKLGDNIAQDILRDAGINW